MHLNLMVLRCQLHQILVLFSAPFNALDDSTIGADVLFSIDSVTSIQNLCR